MCCKKRNYRLQYCFRKIRIGQQLLCPKVQQRHGLEHDVCSKIYWQLYEFFRQHFRILHFCYKRLLLLKWVRFGSLGYREILFSCWLRWSATFAIKSCARVVLCTLSSTRGKFATLPLRIRPFHDDNCFIKA